MCVCMSVSVCVCVCVCVCIHECSCLQRPEDVLDFLELELHVFVSR